MMPISVSITVHTANVCLIDVLKYSLNIQKPISLKCENIRLPAPVAITINSGETPVPSIKGNVKPAAVIQETVAEPIEKRINAATLQVRTNGDRLNPPAICLI